MITIKGIEIDFDITSPTDMMRYNEAGEKMEKESESIEIPAAPVSPSDKTVFDAYINMLNTMLRIFGNFLDDVFGDGIANQLLGSNPSLTKVDEVNNAIHAAFNEANEDFAILMKKYSPNRAERRATAKKK